MAGLDPQKNYYVRELDTVLSGAVLMKAGLVPKFPRGDFMSVKYHFEER
jgi:hypothetical protein